MAVPHSGPSSWRGTCQILPDLRHASFDLFPQPRGVLKPWGLLPLPPWESLISPFRHGSTLPPLAPERPQPTTDSWLLTPPPPARPGTSWVLLGGPPHSVSGSCLLSNPHTHTTRLSDLDAQILRAAPPPAFSYSYLCSLATSSLLAVSLASSTQTFPPYTLVFLLPDSREPSFPVLNFYLHSQGFLPISNSHVLGNLTHPVLFLPRIVPVSFHLPAFDLDLSTLIALELQPQPRWPFPTPHPSCRW